ncbi:MAG: hypothetical protein CTY12_00595 [Methylotenera sp.]|nr:MAG: hypothetical protein CTY12_00595 [Methylotenera sp.]
MATIKVDMSQIEDHFPQRDSIIITSFSWSKGGYNSDPDIEWEFDSSIGDLEYDDEDYVDVDEFNKLREDYEMLDREYDRVKEQCDKFETEVDRLERVVAELTIQLNTKKSFWKVW